MEREGTFFIHEWRVDDIKTDKILDTDTSEIIENLYSKIDVTGVNNIVKELLKF